MNSNSSGVFPLLKSRGRGPEFVDNGYVIQEGSVRITVTDYKRLNERWTGYEVKDGRRVDMPITVSAKDFERYKNKIENYIAGDAVGRAKQISDFSVFSAEIGRKIAKM